MKSVSFDYNPTFPRQIREKRVEINPLSSKKKWAEEHCYIRNLCAKLLVNDFLFSVTCNNLANMCHPRAQCIYNGTLAQYQCACNAGYEGNGFECVETGWSNLAVYLYLIIVTKKKNFKVKN